GADQLLVFTATIIVTLATDLLIGVGTGIMLEFLINLFSGARLSNFFKMKTHVEDDGNQVSVKISGDALFSNFLKLKQVLSALPAGRNVSIDLRECKVIDHTTLHALHEFQHEYNEQMGTLVLLEHKEHRSKGKASTSTRVLRTID